MDSHFFNPEDIAKEIMNKSFLHKRQNLREEGRGSNFFQSNKIRSCSYVKECKGGLKAVPYYDKRQQMRYSDASENKRSQNSSVYSNKLGEHAGGFHQKSLGKYNMNAQRNMMGVSDFKPPYPNSSHIQFGTRTAKDSKHYNTTYRNDLITESKNLKSSNPAIQAFKNKWLRSRLQK